MAQFHTFDSVIVSAGGAGLRTALKGSLYAATAVGMVMGTAVIVTFDPAVGQ